MWSALAESLLAGNEQPVDRLWRGGDSRPISPGDAIQMPMTRSPGAAPLL